MKVPLLPANAVCFAYMGSLQGWLTFPHDLPWRKAAVMILQAKAKVEKAIDVDGGERVQSAVEAGLLKASRRQVSQEGASAPSEKVVSEQHQQQDSPSSSAPAEADLQQTSDEQLQAAIQQLRNQQQDSDCGHAEDSNGSEARESSAVTVESPKQS